MLKGSCVNRMDCLHALEKCNTQPEMIHFMATLLCIPADKWQSANSSSYSSSTSSSNRTATVAAAATAAPLLAIICVQTISNSCHYIVVP